MAVWTSSSSSSKMRLRDRLAFDLIIALKPFLSIRRSFFNDVVNEIKNSLKPSFRRPYLWVSVQKTLRLRGLYDTGADISCMSEKVFRQLPLNARPKKLDSDKPQKFKSAGGEPLPVRGLYEFNLRIGANTCFISNRRKICGVAHRNLCQRQKR